MPDVLERILGKRIQGTRVVPLVLKIVVIFSIFLLISNFVTNYINLTLNQGEERKLANTLLVKDLNDLYTFGLNQAEIYQFNQDLPGAVSSIEQSALLGFTRQKSVALGVRPDGTLLFQASKIEKQNSFTDRAALNRMTSFEQNGQKEGALDFVFAGEQYFGVYKYSDQWKAFFLRADEVNEFNADSVRIFRNVSLIIVGLTLLCVVIGIFLISYILRFVGIITNNIMAMQQDQQIRLLDIRGAPNDEVSYLAVAFNSLASTIDNLMSIFKKFVARDLAAKAYREREIRLEGNKRELAILFSDIKSFTYMTETLGTDIIKLLNMHYDRAIRRIHDHNGDIGSIIGDAVLAIYGVIEEDHQNKSFQAIQSAYEIQEVAASLRREMHSRREEILKQRGALTDAEERVYRAVLLEVGVGIDGGEVFYGTIGSYDRMTNTVIGDNVNSASRLEGLTRLYKVPVIVSEYIRDEVTGAFDAYHFAEIDTVQVKGKTIGRKIYWPIPQKNLTPEFEKSLESFRKGLEHYYGGKWAPAHKQFVACNLPMAEVFVRRTANATAPKDWNGIWTMTEK